MYTKRCNTHSCYPTLRWLNASVRILCICEESRRGRKSRKGRRFTLKPRCSEAARIIQSMQLTRHSTCRTAGRRFPPSRKVTLRKRTGHRVIVDCVVIVVRVSWGEERQRGHEESEEHGDIIREVQAAECCGVFLLCQAFCTRKTSQ